MEDKKLYTLLVYSENVAGILNQITAVFTRRQVNIESLNVSASSIPGVHKYTITAWSHEEQIVNITRQIEKKIDVVKANYFTDDQLFIRETGLYKLATELVMKNPEIYNIFDTGKFLNRPPLVNINQNSGAAGVAHWINASYGLEGEKMVNKHSPVVVFVKKWIDSEYEGGRVAEIGAAEIHSKINEYLQQ